MSPPPVTILSYGMGVESTAILVRWILEPATRPCALSDLLVITAMVGNEYPDTGTDVEQHILPLLRTHQIRFIQVARHGHLEKDGITVLDDSRGPTRIHLGGDYRLSDELRKAGTVPQYGGTHRCSLKFKATAIDRFLGETLRRPARHAFGYNADERVRVQHSEAAFAARYRERIAFGFNREEQARVRKARAYDTPTRVGFYPLVDWGWTRQDCRGYLERTLHVRWQKSACIFCPFATLSDRLLTRQTAHPAATAGALLLERLSLAANPRGTLYRNASLLDRIAATDHQPTLRAYTDALRAQPWAVYRVRRLYRAKGKADRAIEVVRLTPTEADALTSLQRLTRSQDLRMEVLRNIPYAFFERRREDTFPTREGYYVIGPACIETKARHGLSWFEERWAPRQLCLGCDR